MLHVNIIDEAGLERRLQEHLAAWGRSLPEFSSSHAVLGAFFGSRYLGEQVDEERAFLLGLLFSFWFWLDDRSDGHLEVPVVGWEALLAVVREKPGQDSRNTPEGDFWCSLSQRMRLQASDPADYLWWRATAASSISAFAQEEWISISGQKPGYGEYLAVATASTTVENLVAGASLLGGLGLGARHREPLVAQALHYLCTVARLENDLHGHVRERKEGSLANAVLLLEHLMPLEQAAAFITAQLQDYKMLLGGALAELGAEDPFTVLAHNILACHASFYESLKVR
jgi:hypothetical protein